MAQLAGTTGHKGITPFHRFLKLAVEDRKELFGIIIYALLNSLLLLAIPLAAQGLVNVSAAGLAVQPIVVLGVALLIGLLFAGLLTCLRYILSEVILERIFARVALRVAERLPMVKSRYLSESGGPELMNRFFDVINIQKSWFKIVYEVPGALLQIVIGLSLLSLYGMELFAGAAAFIVGGGLIVTLAGMGGVKTSIAESAEKYRVAEWLEEMVRCQESLRLNSRPGFWTEEADSRVVDYLTFRRKHFRTLLGQVVLHYLVSAISMAGMLGFGGYMVLKGNLSLGQLVAAELVIWSMFKATEKLLLSFESYFDLLTGLDKVGYITDLPLQTSGGISLTPSPSPFSVSVDRVSYSYSDSAASPLLKEISFSLERGERVALLGPTGVGKSTLMRLLAGYLHPQSGSVEVDSVDLRELSPSCKNHQVGFVSERNELFAGTVIDNVATGRECDLHSVRELLLRTGGREALRRSASGDQPKLTSAGSTLSAAEQKSVLLSRALVSQPRMLLIDDSLGQLSEQSLTQIVETIFQATDRPTIVCTSSLPQLVGACDRILLLQDGTLAEQGRPSELAADPKSLLVALYPNLSRSLLNLSSGKDFRDA